MHKVRTVLTDMRIAFILTVTITVGGGIRKVLILWAEVTVITFIIYIISALAHLAKPEKKRSGSYEHFIIKKPALIGVPAFRP